MAIVSDEQVIKVLRQYNPWWRNPSTIKEESKLQKRLQCLFTNTVVYFRLKNLFCLMI